MRLSRWEEKVLERDEGRRENRRGGLPLGSPELPVFFLEKPKEGRRLESMLWRGYEEPESLDMGPAMEVGGYRFSFFSSA